MTRSGRNGHLLAVMSEDIPFDKTLDSCPRHGRRGRARRAPRAGQQSRPVHLQGHRQLHRRHAGRSRSSIPAPTIRRHIGALLDAVRGETVTHIFVTHTHRDHSPGRAGDQGRDRRHRLRRRPAPRRAAAAHRRAQAARRQRRHGFQARRRARPTARWSTATAGASRRSPTPGHTANHMATRSKGTDILFSGDHVMAWATSIVAPPDGAMSDYMASLHKLARARARRSICPATAARSATRRDFVQHYIRHRKAREASILHRLGKGETDIPTLVRAIYIGLDPRLTGAAGLSVLAHLEDLVARGVVDDRRPAVDRRHLSLGGLIRSFGAGVCAGSSRPSAPAARLVGASSASSMSSSRVATRRALAPKSCEP